MNYIETKIIIEPNTQDNRDILTAMLAQIDYESFTDCTGGILAYIPEPVFNPDTLTQTIGSINSLFDNIQHTNKTIEDQNWNQQWEQNFEPITIKNQCIIRAPFHSPATNYKYELIIEPKMSFGTGHHATTELMVTTMLNLNLNNKTILDMGCGTGVLAILASKMGASSILAVDIDNWAYENTIENTERNNTKNIETLMGGANLLNNKLFDIILANINRNILLADMQNYYNCLNINGQLLMSGFYVSDLQIITNKANELKLKYISHIEKDNWVAALFTK